MLHKTKIRIAAARDLYVCVSEYSGAGLWSSASCASLFVFLSVVLQGSVWKHWLPRAEWSHVGAQRPYTARGTAAVYKARELSNLGALHSRERPHRVISTPLLVNSTHIHWFSLLKYTNQQYSSPQYASNQCSLLVDSTHIPWFSLLKYKIQQYSSPKYASALQWAITRCVVAGCCVLWYSWFAERTRIWSAPAQLCPNPKFGFD